MKHRDDTSTLAGHLRQHARARGHQVAIETWRDNGVHERITYRELADQSNQFAAFLFQHAEDSIVLLYMSKSQRSVAAICGAMISGKAFAFLNQKFRSPQIQQVIAQTGASVCVIDAAGLLALRGGMVADSLIAETTWWLIRDNSFGKLHQVLAGQLAKIATVKYFDDLDPGVEHPIVATGSAQKIGCCLFTSGSTGTPKGVLISAADLHARARAEAEWFALTNDDVLLSLLPFSFDVGLNQLLSALSVGCKLVLLDSWFPQDILRAAADCQVTGISSVPSIWSEFINSQQRFSRDHSHRSLRYVTVSGGDLSRQQLRELPEVVDGAGIYKTYGQTEAFRLTSQKPSDFPARPHSVGRPFIGTQVYVVHDDGTIAAPHETGEVVMTGLGMMMGYLDQASTEEKLRPNPFFGPADSSTHAIFTGDLGYVDEDGHLFLQGRRDEMIKIMGNRIYPSEVSEQIYLIDGVAKAEVVSFEWNDSTRIAAFVVPCAGLSLDIRAVKARLSGSLPSYMVPNIVITKTTMPLTANGKPDLSLLKQEAIDSFDSRVSCRTSAGQFIDQ